MNILLVPVGSQGDVYPYFGLALALRARGHRPTLITNPFFEPLARKLELDFVGLESFQDVGEFFRDPEIWRPRHGWRLAGRWGTLAPMRETYQAIADRYEPGETVVVAAYSSFGARIAHEKLGVPLASVVLEPDKLRSEHETARMCRPLVLGPWVPRPLKRLQFWGLDRWFIDRFVGPETNAFRAELGLPPTRHFLRSWCLSPERVLALFPAWYARPQPDWPAATSPVGFIRWEPEPSADAVSAVEDFFAAGTPPIVFNPGSPIRHAHDFFSAAVDACRALGRRGVLVTQYPDQLPRDLPDGVRHFNFVPFARFLPRAAAFVYHGGMSSVGPALAAGVPQVIVPMSFNQPDDAARLARLGVASVLPPQQVTAARLARALAAVFDVPEVVVRCQALAETMNDSAPVERACDLIEELGQDRGGDTCENRSPTGMLLPTDAT